MGQGHRGLFKKRRVLFDLYSCCKRPERPLEPHLLIADVVL